MQEGWVRALAALILAATAAGTGVFWSAQRAERAVDAVVSLSVDGLLGPDGSLSVSEQLVVAPGHGPTLTRLLLAEGAVVFGQAVDGADQPIPHQTVPVAGGVAVVLPIQPGASTIRLDYTLSGITTVGEDAVAVLWALTDDRSPVTLSQLDLQLRWQGGETAAILDAVVPGTVPTIAAQVGRADVTTGRVRAHHEVEVHAALHRSAVPDGRAQPLSVMEAMAEEAAAEPRSAGGGGPAWPPLAMALAAVVAWLTLRPRDQLGSASPLAASPLDPPSDHTPAEVAWLLRRGATREEDIAATLADLQSRQLVERSSEGWSPQSGRLAGRALLPHEQLVVEWLSDVGHPVSPDSAAAAVRRDPALWRSLRRSFASEVAALDRTVGLVPRTVGAESVLGIGVAGAALLVAGVIGTAQGQLAWLACVVVGALATVVTESWAQLSIDGARLAARWRAYAERMVVDPAAAAMFPGHALALGCPIGGHHVAEAASELVEAAADAFLAATSVMSLPVRPRAAARPLPR